jgi:transcriptional regulator with XRE-family HTH domain
MSKGAVAGSARPIFRHELLQALAEATGMGLADIAREVGVTKSSVSKWLSGTDRPKDVHILKLCAHYQLPPDFFYDEREYRPLKASAVAGNVATFIQAAPLLQRAERQVVIFQTGAPKAPLWWREKVRRLVMTKSIEFRVIVCIPRDEVTLGLIDSIEKSIKDYTSGIHLKFLPEEPQLCFDVMVIDDRHIFFAVHGDNFITRCCGTYIEDAYTGAALGQWLSTRWRRAKPSENWIADAKASRHVFSPFSSRTNY